VPAATARTARAPFGSAGTLRVLRTQARRADGDAPAARARTADPATREPDTAKQAITAAIPRRCPARMRIKGSVFSVLGVFPGATAPAQAFSERRLGAVLARLVVDAAGHLGRTVVLFHPAPGVVMGVPVPLAVPEVGGPPVVGVTQVGGDIGPRPVAGVVTGPRQRCGDPVRFGRTRQVDDGLSQVELGLGQPHELDRPSRRVCHHESQGSARPTSSLARITRRRAMNRASSPPSSMRANQYSAASGSDPRIDLISALTWS